MTGRIVIYTILLGAVATMAYVGATIGAKYLVYISVLGIGFLLYNFFAGMNK